jgi:hypothetical protein
MSKVRREAISVLIVMLRMHHTLANYNHDCYHHDKLDDHSYSHEYSEVLSGSSVGCHLLFVCCLLLAVCCYTPSPLLHIIRIQSEK